jgi:hypothetical protein
MVFLQIPEKWYPETFDICGASHQILHVMVILAGLAHTVGRFRAFRPCPGITNRRDEGELLIQDGRSSVTISPHLNNQGLHE